MLAGIGQLVIFCGCPFRSKRMVVSLAHPDHKCAVFRSICAFQTILVDSRVPFECVLLQYTCELRISQDTAVDLMADSLIAISDWSCEL